MYFLTSFMVLLRQLRRLYISSSIFQVPLVYNYSTCYTNRVLTRFNTPSTRLRVWFAYASSALLKRQLRGEVRQYIDHVAHLNRIDSHHHPKEHTILYVFRAPGYDSPVLLSWYKHLYILKIYLIKYLATNIALIKSIGIIYCIFVRRLTTTIIFINLLLLGKSTTKLIEISRHLYIRIGSG